MGKKMIVVIIFLAILAVAGYFLYNHFLLGTPAQNIGLIKNLDTNFDTNIFADQKFIDLKDNLGAPIIAGEKGKINPFMKF